MEKRKREGGRKGWIDEVRERRKGREGGRDEGRYLDKGVGRVGIFGVEVEAGAFDDFDGGEEVLEA